MRLRDMVIWALLSSIGAIAIGTAAVKVIGDRYESVLEELKGGKP